MNQHLKEIVSKEHQEQKSLYYQEQLEAVYSRIENLEVREQAMMKSLQNTMQQHNSIQQQEK